MKHDAVIILSGGLDSTTLLYDLRKQGYLLTAVTFDYGQRHNKEIAYATRTCERLAIPRRSSTPGSCTISHPLPSPGRTRPFLKEIMTMRP